MLMQAQVGILLGGRQIGAIEGKGGFKVVQRVRCLAGPDAASCGPAVGGWAGRACHLGQQGPSAPA